MHGRLDRERATRYELVIVATDGKYYDEKKVKVIITDDNDNAPQCTQVTEFFYVTIYLITQIYH